MFTHTRTFEKAIRYISLDVDNPRLIGYKRRGAFGKQSDIVKVLAEHYDVLEICKSILRNGFHPDEILITIPRGSENSRGSIVVEGNRRLCACKILHNPDLLKGTSQYLTAKRFKSHSNYEQVIKAINKLNIVELPGRMEAASYLASKHTQAPIKGWSIYTQGAYYMSLKPSTTKLSDLKATLNDAVPLDRIKKVVFLYQLCEYILDMECWTDDEYNFLVGNIDTLKVEAIYRLVTSSEFKEKIGVIKIDDKGDLKANGFSIDSFRRVMEKLARDAHFNEKDDGASVINTRQENKQEIKEYLEELSDVQNSIFDESIALDNEINISGPEPEDENGENREIEEDASNVNPIKPSRKWTKLLPESTKNPVAQPKLTDLIDEAKKLDVKRYKYSSVLLSRVLFEIMLKIKIREKGLETEIKTQYKEKSSDFDSVLKFSESHIKLLFSDISSQKAIRAVIQGLLQRDKEMMNLANHNDMHILSEMDALHIRDALQTFANVLLSNVVE